MLGHCIPPEVILRRLVAELLRKCDAAVQHALVDAAALYDSRLRLGQRRFVFPPLRVADGDA